MCKKELHGNVVHVNWIDDNGEYNLDLHGGCWNKMTTLFRAWQKLRKVSPYSFPAVSSRFFANALSFLLEEQEGIIAQGEDEDGKMHKFAVWKEKGMIRAAEADSIDASVGSRFWNHEDKGDAITEAINSGTEFYEI